MSTEDYDDLTNREVEHNVRQTRQTLPARLNGADLDSDFPSTSPTDAIPDTVSMSQELAYQAANLLTASHDNRASSSSIPYSPHRQAPESHLSNSEQLAILREAYARNPNPGKRELELLAERSGRPWNKIREYFRQRRNKLRGLADLDHMEEPGRTTSWLQVTYRAGLSTSTVSQLNLYSSYRDRFDPSSAHTPLLGGQELIQLACATFPSCRMARDQGDYVLKGLRERSGGGEGEEGREKGLDGLAEPIRAGTWLLNSFQSQAESSIPSLTQTELYIAYANRFPSSTAEPTQHIAERHDFEAKMESQAAGFDLSFSADQPIQQYTRLLNPVELITLARMAFAKCEPCVDEYGRFVIKGLERREGVEQGKSAKSRDMFPFALASDIKTSNPTHPLTSFLKRKLELLSPKEPDLKKAKSESSAVVADPELSVEDTELLEGLKRFKESKLGHEVGEICVSQ